jgi:hypothetical protein
VKSTDVQDELAEGFEATALPPVAPDGGLELAPLQKAPRHPPRLCEQGPCRNYHTFKIELDSAKPIAVRDASGTLTPQADGRNHEETHHYCYPSPGIELKLGSLPIIHCNRWEPLSVHEVRNSQQRIDGWFEGQTGRSYLNELAAYRLEQERIAKEEAGAVETAAADLAAMPPGECELRFEIRNAQGVYAVDSAAPLAFRWDRPLGNIRDYIMFRECREDEFRVTDYSDFRIFLIRPRVGAPWAKELAANQTVSQVGLSPGDLICFDNTGELSATTATKETP